MGLDMYLKKLTKPDFIKEGEFVRYDKLENLRNRYHLSFYALDTEEKTVLDNSVKCKIEERYHDVPRLIMAFLKKISTKTYTDVDPINVNTIMNHFSIGGSYYKPKETGFTIYPDTESAKDALKSIKDGTSIVIEETESSTILVKIFYNSELAPKSMEFILRYKNETCTYDGIFDTVIWKERYVTISEELAYQRKGLNDYGWELLPENCAPCDDKVLIGELVREGGLSEDFINKWIPGRTIFYAWW